MYIYRIYVLLCHTKNRFSQPYSLNPKLAAKPCQFVCTKHYSAKFPHYEGFDLSQAAVPVSGCRMWLLNKGSI